MAEWLLWLALLLFMVLTGLYAWYRYRQHRRRAEARSRAALNRLLAEADEIEQQARRERATEDPPER
jgi:cbb3-type cytochrome oxidase subunit 3